MRLSFSGFFFLLFINFFWMKTKTHIIIFVKKKKIDCFVFSLIVHLIALHSSIEHVALLFGVSVVMYRVELCFLCSFVWL